MVRVGFNIPLDTLNPTVVSLCDTAVEVQRKTFVSNVGAPPA